MGKKDEALAKLLLWQLQGLDDRVAEAMREHPDLGVAEAVETVEREHPELARLAAAESDESDGPTHGPRPKGPELAALHQEFVLFRHLMTPGEAVRIEARFKELSAHPDPQGIAELRRNVRTLGLEASFWRELAGPTKPSNALGIQILDGEGHVVARSGETAYLERDDVAATVRTKLARQRTGIATMHLPVGRLLVVHGGAVNFSLLFRQIPSKEVTDVLQKTLRAIRENPEAATRTLGDRSRAVYYADALLRLVQRMS